MTTPQYPPIPSRPDPSVSEKAGAVPPPWTQPQYVETEPGKGLAVAALVCGIVGSVFGFIPLTGLIAVALGLAGLVLGVIAWRKRAQADLRKTMAVWGTCLSVVALTLGIIGMVIVTHVIDDVNEDLEQIGPSDADDYNPPSANEIDDASTDELWEMWGEAPADSDGEDRIEVELRARGEL